MSGFRRSSFIGCSPGFNYNEVEWKNAGGHWSWNMHTYPFLFRILYLNEIILFNYKNGIMADNACLRLPYSSRLLFILQSRARYYWEVNVQCTMIILHRHFSFVCQGIDQHLKVLSKRRHRWLFLEMALYGLCPFHTENASKIWSNSDTLMHNGGHSNLNKNYLLVIFSNIDIMNNILLIN